MSTEIPQELPQWLINIAALESFRLDPGMPPKDGNLGTALMYCMICGCRMNNIGVPDFEKHTVEKMMQAMHKKRMRHLQQADCKLPAHQETTK